MQHGKTKQQQQQSQLKTQQQRLQYNTNSYHFRWANDDDSIIFSISIFIFICSFFSPLEGRCSGVDKSETEIAHVPCAECRVPSAIDIAFLPQSAIRCKQ